jgi:hypothetical protein
MYVGTLIEDEIDLPRLREVLDGLGHIGRVATIRGWDRRTQARLYEAAKGFLPIGLDFFVPSGTEPLVEVIHHGKNSLPAFTHFQKRFCRPKEGASQEELWGYNHTSEPVKTPVGPGFFVVHAAPEDGEVDIDYTRLPPAKPDAWPEILPNDARLSRFVYNGLIDRMRGISSHVSIGRGYKGGKAMDAWFVLCREDPKPA